MNQHSKKFLASILTVSLVVSPLMGMSSYAAPLAPAPPAPVEVIQTTTAQSLLSAALAKLSLGDAQFNKVALFVLKDWLTSDPVKTSIKAQMKNYIEYGPDSALLSEYGFTERHIKNLFDESMSMQGLVVDLINGTADLNAARPELSSRARAVYELTPSKFQSDFSRIKKSNGSIKEALKLAAEEALQRNDLMEVTITDTNGVITYKMDLSSSFEGSFRSQLLAQMNINESNRETAEKLSNAAAAAFTVMKQSTVQVLNDDPALIQNYIIKMGINMGIVKITNVTVTTPVEPPKPSVDVTKPVLSLNGASSIEIEMKGTYVELGATALDDTDGNLTSSIVVTSNVNTQKKGTYQVSYQVTDKAGNVSTVVRTIIVDKEKTNQGNNGNNNNNNNNNSSNNDSDNSDNESSDPDPVEINNERTPLGGGGNGLTPATNPAGPIILANEEVAKSGNVIMPEMTPTEIVSKIKSLGIVKANANLNAQMTGADFTNTMAKLLGFKIANAKKPLDTLSKEGLLKGVKLSSSGKITRDQMAVIVFNMYTKYSKAKGVNENINFNTALKTQKQFTEEMNGALKKLYHKDKIQGEANVTGLDFVIIFYTFFLK